MFCDQVLESIEAIAAGDLTPHPVVTLHLESCDGCRAALADARTVDRLLRARDVPSAPSQFTVSVLTRIRRQRWRSEQRLDAVFNTALVVLLLGVVAAVWAVLRWSGVSGSWSDMASSIRALGAAADALNDGSSAFAQLTLVPSFYLIAGGLAATGLVVWWWAEGAEM